jgi:hypothetical protein
VDDLGAYDDDSAPWADNSTYVDHPGYSNQDDSAFVLPESLQNMGDHGDETWGDGDAWDDNVQQHGDSPWQRPPSYMSTVHETWVDKALWGDDAIGADDPPPHETWGDDDWADAIGADAIGADALAADADPMHCKTCGEPCRPECPANSCILHCTDHSCTEHHECLSDPNIDILVSACIPNEIVSLISLYPLSW